MTNISWPVDQKGTVKTSNSSAGGASELSGLVMWCDVEQEKPRCQQRVLIAYTDHHGKPRVTIGWYTPRWTLESYGFDGEVDDEYNEEADEYYMKEGWVDESWESYYHYPISGVTHWQPLPKHPAT